ncbi:fumarylacetoacetate hydrolase family protein [Halalkalibacter alkalisediminis]|uniref:Fumarylacetoacetate hydrolase family protein n=1 Tax=Halalkalibacter alkalisediminis TaxID=935616 RepID=A0ABV6NLL5_9BACI|nr:fumarylacetoacetate hydrolase family protein [Halalkalibacter alkalisediminis]
MKLLTFKEDSKLKLGIKTDKGVLDVEKAASALSTAAPVTIAEVIENEGSLEVLDALVKAALEQQSQSYFLNEEELQLGPAVPKPGKMICVGLNYRKHAEESNMPIPDYPVLFNKFDNTVAAHNEVIHLPFNSKENDYEAELVIVVGKKAKRIAQEDALDYVFGYCNVNDLSSRDLQFRTNQWLLGKCLDGFSPLGPYLVTSDEIENPNDLAIKAMVNGEIRQNSNTSDMVFKCDEIVSYISDHMTLNPGDIILTGTPEGVALGMPEAQRVYLQDGDEVTIEIEKLGRLTNTFKQEV